MRELQVGDKVSLRGGGVASIERIDLASGRIFGSAYNGHIKLEWDLQGRRVPAVGTDPFDLAAGD